MPFLTQEFALPQPKKAFLFLMQDLGFGTKEAQRIIDKGRLTQNSQTIKKAQVIVGKVELLHFVADSNAVENDVLKNLTLLFSNKDFCVYDKPHNLLTHPKGLFSHTSLNDALKMHFGKNANPIHRLDSQTSGLVVCGLHKRSEIALKNNVQKFQKTYTAILKGALTKQSLQKNGLVEREGAFLIDKPIFHQNTKKDLSIRSFISAQGKPSQTLLRILSVKENASLVALTPLTGRTHQLRVHLDSIGYPILGDSLYGVSENVARYFLETRNVCESERITLTGAPYLCLNASALKFSYKNFIFTFHSRLDSQILQLFATL